MYILKYDFYQSIKLRRGEYLRNLLALLFLKQVSDCSLFETNDSGPSSHMCVWRISPHHQLSDTNWVSDSPRSLHIAQVKGSDLPDSPVHTPIHFRGQSQVQAVPCASDQSEVPTAPSRGLISSLERLLEPRWTFYVDYWFIRRGYHSGAAQWKGELARSFHTLFSNLSINQEALQRPLGFYGGFIT